MPAPPRKSLDKRKHPAAISLARSSTDPRLIALQGGDARKKFTDVMAEALLQRVACGMSAKQCAEDFGIPPGTVRQRAQDDPDGFGRKLDDAYRARTGILADTIIEVAYDPNRTAADKKVIIEALQWTAKMDNRQKYGDQVRVDATHTVSPVILPDISFPTLPASLAPAIDAEFVVENENEDDDADPT